VTALDGLYRHLGTSTVWDDIGVTVSRRGQAHHVAWDAIEGARQLGRPGFVQLLVRGHVPPSDPARDQFSIPVASDADANRLVMSVVWRPAQSQLRRRNTT
jgi:hypothetical protein